MYTRATGKVVGGREVAFECGASSLTQPLGRSCGGKHSASTRMHLAKRALAAAQERYASQCAQLTHDQQRPRKTVPTVTVPNLTGSSSQGSLGRPSSAPGHHSHAPPSRTTLLGEHAPIVPQVMVLRLDEEPVRNKSRSAVHPPAPMGLMGHEEMVRALEVARRCAGDEPWDEQGWRSCGGDSEVEEHAQPRPTATARPMSAPAGRAAIADTYSDTSVLDREVAWEESLPETPACIESTTAVATSSSVPTTAASASAPPPADAPLPPRRAIGYVSPLVSPKKGGVHAIEVEEVLAGAAERVVACVSGIVPNPEPAPTELAPSRPPTAESSLSIADLLSTWPLGSVPLELPSRGSGGGRHAGRLMSHGVYTTRPRTSTRTPPTASFGSERLMATAAAPGHPAHQPGRTHAAEARRHMLRRAQHPPKPGGHAIDAATRPHAHTFCEGRRCQPGVRISSTTKRHRAPPGAPKDEQEAEAKDADGADTQDAVAKTGPVGRTKPPPPPHRPAPGRSPGAQSIAERASAATRQWAAHPSQEKHGADLFVGGPGRATGISQPASPTHTPTPSAPAHRHPPTIRSRRPAWERPAMVAPTSHGVSGLMMSLVPTGEVAEACSAGVSAMVGIGEGALAIAPRRANVTVPTFASLAPPER